MCSLCEETTFKQENPQCSLPSCGCRFHVQCILIWLGEHTGSCPVCDANNNKKRKACEFTESDSTLAKSSCHKEIIISFPNASSLSGLYFRQRDTCNGAVAYASFSGRRMVFLYVVKKRWRISYELGSRDCKAKAKIIATPTGISLLPPLEPYPHKWLRANTREKCWADGIMLGTC